MLSFFISYSRPQWPNFNFFGTQRILLPNIFMQCKKSTVFDFWMVFFNADSFLGCMRNTFRVLRITNPNIAYCILGHSHPIIFLFVVRSILLRIVRLTSCSLCSLCMLHDTVEQRFVKFPFSCYSLCFGLPNSIKVVWLCIMPVLYMERVYARRFYIPQICIFLRHLWLWPYRMVYAVALFQLWRKQQQIHDNIKSSEKSWLFLTRFCRVFRIGRLFV